MTYTNIMNEALEDINQADLHISTKTKLRSLFSKAQTATEMRNNGLKAIQEDKYLSDFAKVEKTSELSSEYETHQENIEHAFKETLTQIQETADQTYKTNLPPLNYEALAFAREDARMLLDPIQKDLDVASALEDLMQGEDEDMRNLLLFTPFTDRYLAARNLKGINTLVNNARSALAPKYLNEKAQTALKQKAELKKLNKAQLLLTHTLSMMKDTVTHD